MPKKAPRTTAATQTAATQGTADYPVLTPFKFGGVIFKSGTATLSAEDAEACLAAGVIGPALTTAAAE